MLVKPISSSLFILASKRNRVRVGYEKEGFCAGLLFRVLSYVLGNAQLTGTNISPPFPPTRFILEPPVGGTEKPLFLLRALPQKNSDFSVLTSDEFNLELVVWHPPGARATLG